MASLKTNFADSVRNISNTTNIDMSSIKSPVIIVLAFFFLIFTSMMLYKYKFRFSIQKKKTDHDGNLLISEPVEPSPSPKICRKNLTVSENGEHSYSFWIFVKDWTSNLPENRLIFCRKYGHTTMAVTINTTDSSLMIHFLRNKGGRRVKIRNTSGTIGWDDPANDVNLESAESYSIPDIYLQRWNHVVISQWGKNMDVYMNGKLIRSFVMSKELRTRRVGHFSVGGHEIQTFNGLISRFKYYVRTLSVNEIYTLYSDGPANNNSGIIPVKQLAQVEIATN